jgi:hypothetical protein
LGVLELGTVDDRVTETTTDGTCLSDRSSGVVLFHRIIDRFDELGNPITGEIRMSVIRF